jgi:hypothetical protein
MTDRALKIFSADRSDIDPRNVVLICSEYTTDRELKIILDAVKQAIEGVHADPFEELQRARKHLDEAQARVNALP